MADESKLGKDWQDDELDAIVADYFDMLSADLAGQPYVNLKHSEALMARIGQTTVRLNSSTRISRRCSMSWGCPWILGLQVQTQLSECHIRCDRQVTDHSPCRSCGFSKSAAPAGSGRRDLCLGTSAKCCQRAYPRLRRLGQKFDPVERDHRNRSLGRAGEEFVIDVEKRQRTNAGLPDLARKVRWVAADWRNVSRLLAAPRLLSSARHCCTARPVDGVCHHQQAEHCFVRI